jgi:hypothetical protein
MLGNSVQKLIADGGGELVNRQAPRWVEPLGSCVHCAEQYESTQAKFFGVRSRKQLLEEPVPLLLIAVSFGHYCSAHLGRSAKERRDVGRCIWTVFEDGAQMGSHMFSNMSRDIIDSSKHRLCLAKCVDHDHNAIVQDSNKQRFLRFEMVVDGASLDPRSRGNLSQGRAYVSLSNEEFGCSIEHPSTSGYLLGLQRHTEEPT